LYFQRTELATTLGNFGGAQPDDGKTSWDRMAFQQVLLNFNNLQLPSNLQTSNLLTFQPSHLPIFNLHPTFKSTNLQTCESKTFNLQYSSLHLQYASSNLPTIQPSNLQSNHQTSFSSFKPSTLPIFN
jgi:hypothetical protein